jgi:hypothetical protein
MTSLAAVLVLALAGGPSDPPRRTGLDASNAARAKAGLLPRKPARTRAEVSGRGFATVRAPAPTFLPAPAPRAEDDADGDAGAGGLEAGRRAEPREPLVAARGRVETVRLAAYEPEATEEPAPGARDHEGIAAPEEIGAVRAAARGVVTEVTLSLRFEP